MGKIILLFFILLISPINENILGPWRLWTFTCKHFILSDRKKYTLIIVTNQHTFKMLYSILSLYTSIIHKCHVSNIMTNIKGVNLFVKGNNSRYIGLHQYFF